MLAVTEGAEGPRLQNDLGSDTESASFSNRLGSIPGRTRGTDAVCSPIAAGGTWGGTAAAAACSLALIADGVSVASAAKSAAAALFSFCNMPPLNSLAGIGERDCWLGCLLYLLGFTILGSTGVALVLSTSEGIIGTGSNSSKGSASRTGDPGFEAGLLLKRSGPSPELPEAILSNLRSLSACGSAS